MGRVGEEHQTLTSSGDRSHHFIGGEYPTEWGIATGQALAANHDVGHDFPVVNSELTAGSAEASHDLVGDEQHTVLVTKRPDVGPPTVGRHQRAGCCAHYRLGDDRSHRFRPLVP